MANDRQTLAEAMTTTPRRHSHPVVGHYDREELTIEPRLQPHLPWRPVRIRMDDRVRDGLADHDLHGPQVDVETVEQGNDRAPCIRHAGGDCRQYQLKRAGPVRAHAGPQ